MDGSAEGAATVAEAGASRAGDLAHALGVSPDGARKLLDAGYDTPEAVRALTAEELRPLELSREDREALRPSSSTPAPGTAAGANPDQIVERWVGSVSKQERSRRPRVAPSGKASADVLRRWVGGDDRAMEDWIRASETAPAAPSVVPSGVPGVTPSSGGEGAVPTSVAEREETVVRWLMGLLDRVKSEQFDPGSMIQEVQELQRQLFDERAHRKQLEDQVEHVKRGSIAVIKYVRSREAKEREAALHAQEEELARLRERLAGLEGAGAPAPSAAGADRAAAPAAAAGASVTTSAGDAGAEARFAAREQAYIDRETELRRRVVHLEGESRRFASELEQAKAHGQASAGAMDGDLARRLEEASTVERDLVARENALGAKFEEIRLATEELDRRKGPLEFKEKELAAYDQQLDTRRRALDLEARKLEETRRELGVGTVTGMKPADRLEARQQELAKKEEELRGRESLLAERTRELERLSNTAASADAERLHAESVADAAVARVHSGVRRLDDLLFGGFVPGTQLLVNGPAHTGKDVLARLFSTEGLRQGIPSIWIVTDKTYSQVRDDLVQLYPGAADAERKGLIKFVDLYSLGVGASASVQGVRFLSSNDRGVIEQLSRAVDGFAEQLKEQHPTYRLIFESVSTVTAYLDTTATFRFLQPFIGRRKLDGAVGYYELESGMHSEADLETLEHMVDGSVNLKIEQMKTFLAVRGIGEAQARSWIGYTFTKRAFNLGSFSLEHIR